MKDILKQLSSPSMWEEFYQYKIDRRQLSKSETTQLALFIEEKRYLDICKDLHFSYPEKRLISKIDSRKKRTVYTYSKDETWVLKLLAYLLYDYDHKLSDNCYSFRRNINASHAFEKIKKIKDINDKYVLKLDIHDYFNSIDVDQLLVILKSVIEEDDLYEFLKYLLKQDKCYFNGELIEEKRGAMAGVPLASFFANFYLIDLNRLYEANNIPFFRYSDDMIIFFDSKEQLDENFRFIESFLKDKNLQLNMDKYQVSEPGSPFDFLGFSYFNKQIDLSDVTIKKMKAKIRRKAKKIYTNRKKKGLSYNKAAKAMINSFDHKFYDFKGDNDFTWIRFYFPLINCTEGLHEIDKHMVMYLRYLYNGRHNKANYRITYEQLKKLGYTPLVAEYYNWKKENHELYLQNQKPQT
ncbi:MAG: hypothetical protein J6S49_07740 [Erysipelotrichaceae bacterium]|nr:hypothetical protein [Erysipelotrichaceae bacterium]